MSLHLSRERHSRLRLVGDGSTLVTPPYRTHKQSWLSLLQIEIYFAILLFLGTTVSVDASYSWIVPC